MSLKTIFIDMFSVFSSYGECGLNQCVGIKLLNEETKVFQNTPFIRKTMDSYVVSVSDGYLFKRSLWFSI